MNCVHTKKETFKSYPPGPQNGDRVFKRGNRGTKRSLWLANRTDVLIKRGDLNTDMHTPRNLHEDRERIRVTLLQAKEHQGLPAATRSQGRGLGQIPASEPPEGTTPDNVLPLDFRPPELQGNTFLVSKPPSLGYFGTAALGKSHVEGGRQRWGQGPDPHNFQEPSTNLGGGGCRAFGISSNQTTQYVRHGSCRVCAPC